MGAAPFSLRPTTQRGQFVGAHLQIEGRLGRGGTADVFLARDLRDLSLVVVKRLRQDLAENPELRSHFLKEAEALSHVSHPGVVRVLSIEDREEPPYLTLEALPGETLGEYLDREGRMEPELALRLVRQTAHALEAVHAAGIVHRDLKPDNLFLVGHVGAPEILKVLDFGMAKLETSAHPESDSSILGTVQYMPPEQILVEPVDGRTDVYALGVVLFRALTGHLPFEGPDKASIIRHQLFSPVPPPSWLEEDIPPELEEIVLRATQKNPKDRYPSMRDFGAALDRSVGLGELLSEPRPRESSVENLLGSRYEPVTTQGRRALEILARDFGIFASASLPKEALSTAG